MGIKDKKMSEGRKTQIVLLDERRLEILIQPKLYAGELLDLVASHFNLKEKEYFGLSFKDETNTKQNKDSGHYHWLQLDRKVLEHDFPKKSGPLVLYFAVRFFIESIAYLRDNATIELFYLQAKHSVFKDHIECDSDSAFELAAHVLQATYSDFTDEETAKEQLKKLPVLPTSCLKEHPSISYCEEEVLNYYKKLAGQSRGSAIVNYMTIVESLPTYGIHYYEVKDKSGIPWWLGLSYKGVSQYDYNDKKVPRRVFPWKQLENLYFRDKKFSIEVHDPKRVSVSRRTFGPGNVNVHAWFASTPALTKCIWSMAVSQHQFYLDRKQSKSHLPSVRSMSEIAADLCQSTSSLPSSASGSMSRSNSAHSLTMSLSTNNTKLDYTPEELESNRAAERDMFAALKARKDALEDALRKKTEELKSLCLKEAEVTGELPPEFPLVAGEVVPPVRRRVGTAFTLSPKIVNRDQASQVGLSTEEELLAKLELEFEIQDKITKAARRLAEDMNASKGVRKQRRHTYHKAYQKYKDLERRLNEARRNCGRAPVKVPSVEEPEFISPVSSPAVQRSAHARNQHPQVKIITSPKVEVVEMEHPRSPTMGGRPLTPSSQGSGPRAGSPVSPSRQGAPGFSRGSTPSPNPQRQPMGGYTPNALYQTRTQYRMQNYPTFTTRSHSSSSTQSEYDNVNGASTARPPPPAHHAHHPQPYHPHPHYLQGGAANEAMHNLYNVNTHQSIHYSSADELGKSSSSEDLLNDANGGEDDDFPCPPGRGGGGMYLPASKHGSLEGAYRRRHHYHPQHPGGPDPNHLQRYASQEQHVGDQPSFIIPNLTPSRFGSKRESTADYPRDASQPPPPPGAYPPEEYTVYNVDDLSHSGSSSAKDDYGDFPPPPPPHELNHWEEESPHHPHHHPHQYQHHHQYQQHPHHQQQHHPHQYHPAQHPSPHQQQQHHSNSPSGYHGGHHGDSFHSNSTTPSSVRDQSVIDQSNGVPYMDSGHSHQAWASQGGDVRQQPPPHTPQTEVPPQPFVQDSAYDSSSSNPMSPTAGADSPQQVMTVTKYQSYVEVSKPFEMSDFYKYSEKLRKQRNIQSRQQKLEAVLSGQPIPKSASTDSSLHAPSPGPPPVPVRYNSYISSTGPGGGATGSPGPLSPVSSAYSSPARPSSPFNGSSQGSQRSSRPSSPYGGPGGDRGSPATFPGNCSSSAQASRTRGPYAVQSNLVQTQYQAQSMAYHGGAPQQVAGAVPQHTSYQAPKAMTCEPVRSSPSPAAANSATKNSPQPNWYYNDSMGYYDDHSGASHVPYNDSGLNNSSSYSDHTPGHSYYDDQPSMSNNNNNLSAFEMSGVANAFSEEMLAWYEDQDQHKPSTLV